MAWPGIDRHDGVGRGLGPRLGGVHRLALALHDGVVDPVLHVGGGVGLAEQAGAVRLVLREQQLAGVFAVEVAVAELLVVGDDHRMPGCGSDLEVRPVPLGPGPPGVAEPQVGQDVQRRRLRPAVGHGDPDEDVFADPPWRIRRRRPSSGPGRRPRCPSARIRTPGASDAGSPRAADCRGKPPAGTCTASWRTSGSACCRGKSSTPSRPRRGCPRRWSARTGAPSGSDPARSTGRPRSTATCSRHRTRPGHPRRSGRPANATARG